MKKLKREGELFKAALLAGVKYAEDRKAGVFEPTDSASEKALFVYRLCWISPQRREGWSLGVAGWPLTVERRSIKDLDVISAMELILNRVQALFAGPEL
jgi:hypothetical protein